ncbi:hypothetical protein [Rubrivivax gelatinosus]|uniref:hypothetical protein n=1 Tax=Rubrivivax gelatinosus TaxID=28068 RepID=UPI00031D41B5|nr:hypothetical protein [Rubrivivax gelatinosus]MBG6082720.1 hypothetical protein [Rubrivivax gelatinosus]
MSTTIPSVADRLKDAALEASYEIDGLADHMIEQLSASGADRPLDYAIRALAVRVKELNGVIMEVCGDMEVPDGVSVPILESLESTVFGNPRWKAAVQ